jgi:sigma-B regulation protein RsbU (phosphoserine phosphatase)
MDTGHLGIVIADVSGHGPAAAVLTAMIRMLLHSCPITSGQRRDPFCSAEAACPRSPHVVLAHLNRALVENSLDEQFMTMVFGIVNLASGEFQFAIAGHMPPCWWQASSGGLAALPDIGGLPLGVDIEACYESATVQMSPGDLLVSCTDGITEAEDRAGRMFGRARLEASIGDSAHEAPDAMKSSMIGRLQEFLNGRNLQDDVTLLILKRVVNRELCRSELFVG